MYILYVSLYYHGNATVSKLSSSQVYNAAVYYIKKLLS